jgi:hypothetical protein
MRPKVVILTLVAAFGLLGIIAVLKGVAGKHAQDADGSLSGSTTNAGLASAATNGSTTGMTGSSSTAVSEQMRAAVIAKEIEQIQQLQGEADGTNNPIIISALLDKISNPEADVRKAAVEALRELNDTNAISGLEKVVDNLKDPREKVAVLDAIDYLKMPSVMADVPATDYSTNAARTNELLFPPASRMNPNFLHKRQNGQQVPAPTGQAQ